jgi:DNA-binding NarL/FixJ family response regulator
MIDYEHPETTASGSVLAPDSGEQERPTERARRPSLLIADDEPVVLATLAAQLTEQFDVVATAEDGESATEQAARHRPDVALIDVQMPRRGGLLATRGIRNGSPDTAVVILSSDELNDSLLEFLSAGAMTYLRKGIPAARIAERLHLAMAAHRTLREM